MLFYYILYTIFFFASSRDESAQKITVFILYQQHLYTKKKCILYTIYTNYVVCVFMLSIAIKNLLFFFIYMTMETKKKHTTRE